MKKFLKTGYNSFLGKFFTFSGRATRYEYLATIVAYIWISALAIIFIAIISAPLSPQDNKAIANIAGIFFTVPVASACFRRMHDLGYSGWAVGVIFVIQVYITFMDGRDSKLTDYIYEDKFFLTYISISVLILLMTVFKKGKKEDNKFGPDPLASEE